ncbi:MAG: 1-deoxy-D-xylulose-5-phosphate synthase [Actinomycetota bacterium]|nr:1-deoxy-D-xylulose-5-phosphate synthase [Actinomycetota bacterium]
MLLDTIDSPADLRRLSPEQLEVLAAEIRHFIVQSVSVTGGHLGSNLGVVELTLAIHRVFDSPDDIILWDTGHQAYVHKIITGRRKDFDTLRQAGGLSGYPSRGESDHDWVENSHASTILSYAHGLATALRLHGEDDRRVVAVLGDGSMTGGMAYEALNNLGHSGGRVLIVLNDNGRSYAPTVGWLTAGLTRLRLNPAYVQNRDRVQRLLRAVPKFGEHLERGIEGVRAAVREVMLEPSGFFEALGLRYIGPVDGHDTAGLERVLRQTAELDEPIIVHAVTQKGRGYGPAEEDDEKCLHDAPVFDPATGPPRWVPVGYTQAFADAMVKVGERDSRVVAVTAAMAGPTGLRPFEDRWPERFIDVGIAEQHAVTAAAGMAMGGLRPVVAIYSTFLMRAIDQVNLDVGLHQLPVVFCIDRAGITGDDGPSHHGLYDIAFLTKVPGMTILAPSSAEELQVMLDHALTIHGGPVAIRYPKGSARQVPPDQVGSGLAARKVQEGDDICILAVGRLVEAAEEAARLLSGQGLATTVWDVRVVKPLDPAMLADAAAHSLVVTVEDGVRQGGAGSAIADALASDPGDPGPVPVLVLGAPDEYIAQGNPAVILAQLGLDGPGIAASVVAALGVAEVVGG